MMVKRARVGGFTHKAKKVQDLFQKLTIACTTFERLTQRKRTQKVISLF